MKLGTLPLIITEEFLILQEVSNSPSTELNKTKNMIDTIHDKANSKPKGWFVNLLHNLNDYFGNILQKETEANIGSNEYSLWRQTKILISKLIVWVTNKIESFANSDQNKFSKSVSQYTKPVYDRANDKRKAESDARANLAIQAMRNHTDNLSQEIQNLNDKYADNVKNLSQLMKSQSRFDKMENKRKLKEIDTIGKIGQAEVDYRLERAGRNLLKNAGHKIY